MRRILALVLAVCLIIIIFLVDSKNGDVQTEITYKTGTFKDYNKKSNVIYENVAIPDKETAIAIAIAIFKTIPKTANTQEYIPQEVFFDTENEVWIVTFANTNPQNKSEKGKWRIALKMKDSSVYSIWFEK